MLEEMLEEEKRRPEVNGDDNIENDPINFGSRLSVSMSMLLLVTFVTRHNLVSHRVALSPDNMCQATLSIYQDCF